MKGLYPQGTRVILKSKSIDCEKEDSFVYQHYVKGNPVYYQGKKQNKHIVSKRKDGGGDHFTEQDIELYKDDLTGQLL